MFKVDELLLLENLTYFPDLDPFESVLQINDITVREFLDRIAYDKIIDENDYASYMTGFDFKNLMAAIRSNENILNCKILEPHFDQAYGGGGGVSCVFIDDKHKEAVVAFRGTAVNEWVDDFVGANQIDSLQQINALEWYKLVYAKLDLENYSVTVIGHSKGGNKAKYITILNKTVNRCVSFDGQGFSDKFIDHYKKEILDRQELIENHNVDFDYVNILLNDIGRKTYYVGFDYGRGGFAESHCPNTFFNFKENGAYNLEVNPNGQRPEMQELDQFINSLIRSNINEKEKTETTELVGALVAKAFSIGGGENTANEYINFFCDTVGDEKYSDNAAFLLTFCIKYSKQSKGFLGALKTILTHFKADGLLKVVCMLEDLVNSKKLNKLINLSNFLILHVHGIVVRKIQSIARKKYNVELTKDQINKVLIIISMVKSMLKTLELNMDGSDMSLDSDLVFDDEDLPDNLNIVVLAGGLSNERNISLQTGFEVYELLQKQGHNVILLDSFMGYNDKEEEIENAFFSPKTYSLEIKDISLEVPDLWAVKKRRVDQSDAYFGPNVLQICKQADIVFIALQGANGENGKVQATFDLLGIDYTGNDYFSSAISSNKIVSKDIINGNKVLTPRGYLVQKNKPYKDPTEYGIKYPVIVKPNNGGIGVGISVVNDKAMLDKALKEAFRWENDIIIEEYIRGREFAVSILDGMVLPIVEVLPLNTDNSNIGLSVTGERVKRCPAQIDKKLEEKIKEAALIVSNALYLTAYAKVDFILTPDNKFYCLECDSQPRLNSDAHIILAAQTANISFTDFCRKTLELSLLKK